MYRTQNEAWAHYKEENNFHKWDLCFSEEDVKKAFLAGMDAGVEEAQEID